MKKIKLGAVLAVLLASVGIATAPSANASLVHWASVVSVSRVTASNYGVPLNPQFRLLAVRVSYRCHGPQYPYADLRAKVYRPRTATWYSGDLTNMSCDGRTHTTPIIRLHGYRDTKFAARENVRVAVSFSAFGGWRPNYASRWTTTVLGYVRWG